MKKILGNKCNICNKCKIIKFLDTRILSKEHYFDVETLSKDKKEDVWKLYEIFCSEMGINVDGTIKDLLILCIDSHNEKIYKFLCEVENFQTILYLGISKYKLVTDDVIALSKDIKKWYEEMTSTSVYFKVAQTQYCIEKCMEEMRAKLKIFRSMEIASIIGIMGINMSLNEYPLFKQQQECWILEDNIKMGMVSIAVCSIALIASMCLAINQKSKIDDLVGRKYNDYYSLYISYLEEYMNSKGKSKSGNKDKTI